MLLGIVGLNGSGKDAFAQILVKKYGFVHFDCGQIIRDDLKKMGKDFNNRNVMISFANKKRKENGNDYWVKRILENNYQKNIVISSIRNPFEIDLIKAKKGFVVKIIANQKIRFERVCNRIRVDPTKHGVKNFLEFKEQEEKELNNKDPSKQQLLNCLEKSDFEIDNSFSIIDLEKNIEKLMLKLV